jgi:ASC-1-like (ASCH) protein
MARPTHTIDIAFSMKKLPLVDKVIDTWSQMDGTATLVRGKDGNAYEIVVRPASETQHPKLKQKTMKRGMREGKSFSELMESLPKPKYIEPPKDTTDDVVEIFKKLYDDPKYTSHGVLTRAGTKLNKELHGKGYWASNTQGKFQLNKIGYDTQGKKSKFVQPRGNNK